MSSKQKSKQVKFYFLPSACWQEAAETLEKQGLKEDAIEFYLRVRARQVCLAPPRMQVWQAAVMPGLVCHMCAFTGLVSTHLMVYYIFQAVALAFGVRVRDLGLTLLRRQRSCMPGRSSRLRRTSAA